MLFIALSANNKQYSKSQNLKSQTFIPLNSLFIVLFSILFICFQDYNELKFEELTVLQYFNFVLKAIRNAYYIRQSKLNSSRFFKNSQLFEISTIIMLVKCNFFDIQNPRIYY